MNPIEIIGLVSLIAFTLAVLYFAGRGVVVMILDELTPSVFFMDLISLIALLLVGAGVAYFLGWCVTVFLSGVLT